MDSSILLYLQRIDIALSLILLLVFSYIFIKGLIGFIRVLKFIYRKVKKIYDGRSI